MNMNNTVLLYCFLFSFFVIINAARQSRLRDDIIAKYNIVIISIWFWTFIMHFTSKVHTITKPKHLQRANILKGEMLVSVFRVLVLHLLVQFARSSFVRDAQTSFKISKSSTPIEHEISIEQYYRDDSLLFIRGGEVISKGKTKDGKIKVRSTTASANIFQKTDQPITRFRHFNSEKVLLSQ